MSDTTEQLKTYVYSSNNSGGSWWLEDEDWYALEKAGWKVEWCKDQEHHKKYNDLTESGRWLGALATSAKIKAKSIKHAVSSWESALDFKHNPNDKGCRCCGKPHSFHSEDYDEFYHG